MCDTLSDYYVCLMGMKKIAKEVRVVRRMADRMVTWGKEMSSILKQQFQMKSAQSAAILK
ncbi:unnamed protein product [Rhodiola kirilowii]